MAEQPRPGADFEQASGARRVALTVRFLLELALLAGAAVLAGRIAPAAWSIVAAAVAVIALGTAWGLLLSPKARFDIGGYGRLGLETTLFVGVAAGLVAIGVIVPAVIGLAVWVLDRLALRLLP